MLFLNVKPTFDWSILNSRLSLKQIIELLKIDLVNVLASGEYFNLLDFNYETETYLWVLIINGFKQLDLS